MEPQVIMWTSTQTSEAMERSLGKGKLKIRPMIFTKICIFFIQEKSFCLAVIFRTDHFSIKLCFC